MLRGSYELGPLAARRPRAGRRAARARGPVRPRAARGRHARQHCADRARAAARAARGGPLGGRARRRARAATAAQRRARAARRARAPARRVAARRALAGDRASRAADGQGARRPGRRRASPSCWTRARPPMSAAPPDSSFELAVAAAGALVARAHDGLAPRAPRRSRRRRRARGRGRAHGGAPAAGARAAGRGAPARRSARPPGGRAHRGRDEPAGGLVGALAQRASSASSRSIRPASTRPCRATPTRSGGAGRRRRARGRAAAAGARARSPGRRPRAARARPRAAALYALAAAFGLLHARDLQIAGALDREAGGDRRPGNGPGARGAARRQAARPPGPRSGSARRCLGRGRVVAIAGLAARRAGRASLLDAPGTGCRSCCRSRAASTRSCGRACSSRCSRGSRAGVALARAAAPARGRAGRAAAVRRQRDRLRAAAASLARTRRGRPAARVPVHGPRRRGRRATRAGVRARWRSRSAPAGPPCPRRRIRPCCPGRPGRSRTPGDRAAVDLVWDMSYRPLVFPDKPVEVLQVRAPRRLLLAGGRARRVRRPALLALAPGDRRHARRRQRARAGSTGGTTAARRGAGHGHRDSFLVAPGRPVRYALPPARGRSISPRTGRRSSASRRPPGSDTPPTASIPTRARPTLRSLPAAYPAAIVAGELRFAGEAIPPFGRAGREADLAALFRLRRADPVWRAWQAAYAQARTATRGAATPYQAVVALEAWLRTTRAYDEHACLPEHARRARALGGFGRCGPLPDVRRVAGCAGAPLRRAGSRRRGVCARRSARRRLPRDRSRCARVGRGVVPGVRLAAVRRDARALAPRARLVLLGLVRRPGGTGAPRPAGRRPRPLQLPLAQLRAGWRATGGRGDSGSSWWDTPCGADPGRARRRPRGAAAREARRCCGAALPRDPAGAARGRVGSFAADQGLELSPALTPREFGAALERRFGVAGGGFAARSSAPPTPRREPGRRRLSRPRPTGSWMRCAARSDRVRRLRGAFSLRGLSAARDRAR